MKKKPSPLVMAIAKVHQIPPPKEPKGNSLVNGDSYYYPPDLYISDKDYPGVSDFKAGSEVSLLITAKVSSLSTNTDDKGQARTNATLKITSIGEAVGGAK